MTAREAAAGAAYFGAGRGDLRGCALRAAILAGAEEAAYWRVVREAQARRRDEKAREDSGGADGDEDDEDDEDYEDDEDDEDEDEDWGDEDDDYDDDDEDAGGGGDGGGKAPGRKRSRLA
jgi:hypothetical protein